MKTMTLFIIGIVLITPLISNAATHVRGYVRRNGTYVEPYYRSEPDHNPYNNWSVWPNINPYTGTVGTHHPYDYGNYFHVEMSPSFYPSVYQPIQLYPVIDSPLPDINPYSPVIMPEYDAGSSQEY